jgi:diguanylate cyclase (GGDEF)-like protein
MGRSTVRVKMPRLLLPENLEKKSEALGAFLGETFGGGVEIVCYRNPDQAMKLLSGETIDLLVLPLEQSGTEHRGLIAVAGQSEPAIPVIGLTTGDLSRAGRLGLESNLYDFLQLPQDEEKLAMVIRNALRWRETSRVLHETEAELHTLDEVGRAIISSLELKTVLNIIMEKIRELVQSEAWSLLLVDEKTGELHCSVAVGEHADHLRQFNVKFGEGVAGWVAREGKPVVIHDVNEDPRFFNEMETDLGFKTRSILCAPLETRGKVLGVLEVINKKGEGGFTDRDLNLTTRLAGFAAVAIENARLYHQAKLLTMTDELTHLYNSRFFNQFLDSEVKRCQRYDSNVSLIFLDLDHFKNINDHYGHLIGSKLLQEAADVLRAGLRDVDVVARYGGDEFLVILPETKIEEASRVANRMRSDFDDNIFLSEDGVNVRVTASFGVSSFPEFSSSKEELIRMADKAMYRVKNANRNGVFVADDPDLLRQEEGVGK